MFKKELRGPIQERPPRKFAAPRNADKLHFHQCLDDMRHTDPAHGLDRCLGNGLAVRNDRHRFQRRLRKAMWLRLQQMLQPSPAFRIALQPIATSGLVQCKSQMVLLEISIQLLKRITKLLVLHVGIHLNARIALGHFNDAVS